MKRIASPPAGATRRSQRGHPGGVKTAITYTIVRYFGLRDGLDVSWTGAACFRSTFVGARNSAARRHHSRDGQSSNRSPRKVMRDGEGSHRGRLR